MLHLDQRLGSLKAGKDADFVILSGSPFSIYTQVLQTWIDGVRLFDRSRQRDWSYQTGGFALDRSAKLPAIPPAVKPPRSSRAPGSAGQRPASQGCPISWRWWLAGSILFPDRPSPMAWC